MRYEYTYSESCPNCKSANLLAYQYCCSDAVDLFCKDCDFKQKTNNKAISGTLKMTFRQALCGSAIGFVGDKDMRKELQQILTEPAMVKMAEEIRNHD